ncbi:hypothetical protein [Marinicella litoralis]|uniref:HYR domain-containing protein n=1 Tax=Marinicella litoralis TaxID=644220 RepID=A0A4R6XZB0_9GAMM|nr:hypothetical protein [Marinicella litoralis]TDR23674.1 hypothetical protein C8D91_0538 [Marinicella litoralis]
MKRFLLITALVSYSLGWASEPKSAENNQLILGSGLVNISFPNHAQIENNIRSSCALGTPAISVPVVCQQFGSFTFNFGKDKITKLGLKDILMSGIDPFGLFNNRESLKKRILVGTGLMIAGASIVATCPPIPVEEGWSELSYFERIDRAQAFGYVPPDIHLLAHDVDVPTDPNSCTKTLDLAIDNNTHTVNNFGDFDAREFAYTTPFGSYPSATTKLAVASPALVNCLSSLTDLIDISTNVSFNVQQVDLDFVPNITLDDILDGLDDKIIAAVGFSDFELVALQQFNGWKNNYRSNYPGYCNNDTCQFEHGVNRVVFDADINPASWGNLLSNVTYFQEVEVHEYFDPVITAFPLTVTLEALEIGGTRVSKYPPRSFVGNPPEDRNYTFNKSWLGVVDNCDQNPVIEMEVPDFLPLGIHDFPVTVTDRVGNQVNDFVQIIVDDTIPPDLEPKKPLGILVPDGTTAIGFNDPGIGCDAFLCEGSPPTVEIYPPTYFDFGSLTPDVDCEMDNVLNLIGCDGSLLPVNDMSLVNWQITDPSGNVSALTQQVYVREESINQAPTTPNQSYVIGQDQAIQIPLNAEDGDFDPLMFSVLGQPTHGNVDGDPEAVFQTRFNTTGLLASSNGMASVDNFNVGQSGLLVSSAAEQRVYLFLRGSVGELINRYDLGQVIAGGITPNAITFGEGKQAEDSSGNLSQVLRNKSLWIGDWQNRKVYLYNYNDLSNQATVVELLTLPAGLQTPVGITADRSGSTVKLVIADSSDQQLWRFDVNANTQTLLSTSSYEGVGIIPDHVDFSGNSSEVFVSSKVDKAVVKYNFSLGVLGSWPIDNLLDDPDGEDPALPVLQDAVDFVVQSDGFSFQLNWFDATEFKLVETVFQTNAPNTEPTIQSTFRMPYFVEILALEETTQNGITQFVMLAEGDLGQQYLIRYDLQGRIDAITSLYSGQSLNPIPPTSNTSYVDIALKDNGDVLLLDQGNNNNFPSIVAIQLNTGVDAYQYVTGNMVVDFLGNDALPSKAIDISGNQVVVMGTKSIGTYQLGQGAGQGQVLVDFSAAINQYADLAISDGGVVYASDTGNNQVDSFDSSTGAFLQSIGAGDLDFNAEPQYGRLFYDNVLNKLWVSDFAEIFYPDLGTNGETHRMPRLLGFGPTGNLLDVLKPEGTPGEFFSFLEPGDFGTITAIAAGDEDRFYVAEAQPLNRLHVFDSQIFVEVSCEGGPDNLVCNLLGYTPNLGYVGSESMTVIASDPFGAASNEAVVDLTIINDTEAPVVSCPAAIEVQANSTLGYMANLAEPDKEVDAAMRSFLLGASHTENTDLPPVIISNDIPQELLLGENTITFIGIDGSNNQGQCQSSITVVDTLAPVFSDIPVLTFEAIGPLSDLSALGVDAPEVNDNSSINNLVVIGETLLPVGTNRVTWQATDIAGNLSQTIQIIEVVDSTPPVISGVVDATQHSNDTLTAISYVMPEATDLVSSEMNFNCLPATGTMVSQGEQAVSCHATDEANNQSNRTFLVSVFGDADFFEVSANQYSDTINGGNTDISITQASGLLYLVYDAPTPEQGLTLGLMSENPNRGPMNQLSLSACQGQYNIPSLNFEDLLFDDITERFGDRVTVSCNAQGQASKISSLVGNFTVELLVVEPPVDTTVELDLSAGNEISLAGLTLTANSDNASDSEIRVYGKTFILAPGSSMNLYGADDLIYRHGFE